MTNEKVTGVTYMNGGQDDFLALLKKHGFDPPVCGSHVWQGWWPILEDLLPKLQGHVAHLAQIKAKFNHLCVYVEDYTPTADYSIVQAAIGEAVFRCAATCEFCGQAGTNGRCGKCVRPPPGPHE